MKKTVKRLCMFAIILVIAIFAMLELREYIPELVNDTYMIEELPR